MEVAKLPEKAHFEPCEESKQIGRELAKEESLKNASQLYSYFKKTTPDHGPWLTLPVSKVGLNLVVDRSGKLLSTKKLVSRKDVIANPRVSYLQSSPGFPTL